MSEDDIKRLLSAEAGQRDGVLLRLLYAAGLRLSEACGLRWRNLCREVMPARPGWRCARSVPSS